MACSPAVRADGCGYFADRWCTGAASQPEPACLGECLLDEDCDDGAHCDVTCQPDLPDGRICDEDSDCASGHCGNGFCCRAGDCCAAPDSCPAAYREAPVCDDPRSCQGHRRDATCLGSICALGPVIDDDRACAAGRLSDACGLYPAVFCTGEVEQEDPPCVRSCAGDLDCDPEAHCDQGTCQGDLPDGRPCLEDSDCASNHCGNDFCCGEGDCCAVAADCPAGWRAAPRCEQPGACQGSRVDAQCGADFRCRSTTVADDSACTRLTLSDACGFFADVYCTGLVEQQDPSCPALCALDADCDGAAHCDETCLPDLPDGRVCDEDSDCASGHCGNGFCCRAGDCCIAAASCPPRYTLAPVCDVASSCQGHRQKATCLASTCGTSEPIADDRGCTAGLLADECGLYPAVRCTGESDQLAPACPVRCAVDADCDREAHCFQGACRRDLADGEACGADTHCAGGHCGNGFCCRAGDCCGQAAHCPAGYRQAPLCERPSACQGNRVDALCDEDHRCRSLSVDDDSACSAQVLSDGCGYFADVFCSGARIQNDPPCPGSCMTDDKCDDGAHCDGTCQPDAPDGQACDEDSDCLSGHCANGFCCRAGDCCAVAAGCPARYRLSPVCDAASTCQGHRLDATCIDSICGTSPRVDDDRGCGAGLLSDGCGLYPAVHCTGEAVQQDPPCPQQCAADEGCDPGAHCDEGECRSDLADGQRCDEDSDCQSGHCGNGFCCRAGDCCALAADCPPAYASPPRCDRPSACQGSRLDAVCDEERRCRSRQVDDDSACTAQLLSDACGFFQDVYCNGGQNQQDPPCPAVCAVEGDCDPGAHCDVTCLPDLADGRVCDEDSDCASGHCANSYCCAAGDCCAAAADCPARYRQSPVCDTVATCQGHRRDALCDGNVCGTSAAIDDDRGCVGGLVANACGLYPAVHCTGAAVQLPPVCPDGCFVEEDCDPGAHCRAGVCQGDLGDGQPCLVHSDCISNHCGNGFCCTQGDCCGVAADCPPAYRAAPRCEQPSACQGSRVDALCNGNRCSSLLQQDDSACSSEVLSDDCGFFGSVFCNGQVVQQDPPCPQACATDAQCDPGAHCDGTCLADLADGRRCDEDSDCQSGHCGNGFCCRGGDCCGVAADCPARYAVSPSCDSAATCQGHRHEPTCLGSVCGTSDPVADDRGCSAGMVSDECGLYLAVTCTGQAEQQDPPCPVACLQDAECDQPAHCDGTCLADQPDGQPCDEASDCSSGYCNNGFCCQGGTCCGLAADCPAAFFAPAQCVTPGSCQGSRVDAVCREDRRCASLTVDDDSACTAQLLSDACGFYRDRYCTGAATQQDPPCPVACQQDGDCDADAHCDGTCLADLANGQPCDEHSDCRSSHCQNRFCCAAGDCCQLASDCPAAYRADPVCDSAASCQGHRVDALCGAQDHRCSSSAAIADDRGCGQGLLSDACGLYPAVYCTGAAEQQDPPCPIRCASDAECDPGAHCDGGACLSDQPPGQPCDEPSDCAAGLTCVDGVCCTSACNGLCERCDLSGDGTCLPVPRGQDPSNECGALSCNGYFAGFAGSECRERADLAAAAVACNGAGACQTAAELCPRQGAGDTVLSCHPTCQQPVANSCQGTTPGACNNVNPGSVSCGIGQCTNTVPRCVNGALNVCTPLPAGLEVCNGLDDDCDGWTDAADGDLGTNDRPLCENQTGVCQGSRKPPALCSGGAWQRCSSAEYAAFAGALYQTPAETSCDGRDNDCDGAVDELVGSDVNNCGSCGTVCSNPHGTTSCIAGQCTPVCVGLWGSCDGNRINGCEAALTTLVNCGSCGTPCALANAAESCADGTCRL
ncbi:MAG: hypothetical protein FJ125_01345, partial [Deltaproteobacteria bacterium]|nr:hypothetical protein [Deltaproteobacteria bacterium]